MVRNLFFIDFFSQGTKKITFYADILSIYFITFCSYLPHCPIFIHFLLFSLLFNPPLLLPTQICIIFFLCSSYRNTFIFESRFLHEKEKLYLSCGWVVDIARAKSLQRPYAKSKEAIFLQGPEQEVANAGQRQIQKWLHLEVETLALPLPTVFFSLLQAHIKRQISDLHRILCSNHYRSYSFKTFLHGFSVRHRQQTA